ncbi:MAG: isoleucine--tRNA ligase [Ignavibacteria bacterium]
MFTELPDKINLPQLELQVLKYWKDNNIFEKSISTRDVKNHFVFYEGPPTANGKPGVHHVIARTIKDLVCRYKTLRGFRVHRKAGWDTQGLPVEIEVEKSLGIKSKDDIEKLGVDKFNKACRESVFKYLKEWENLTERMGYWVNLDEAYITYKNDYIESVWWSLKKFFDAGLIYKGYKIQAYCPRCETPLSTHEVAQGYEDVKDPSVYVTFKIKPDEKSKAEGIDGFEFLVWTTTPWTLISNVALAVHPNIDYAKIRFKQTGDKLILAQERLSVIKEEYEVLGHIKGRKLEYIGYEQLLPYVKPALKSFYVVLGDFVTTEDGSGIVHIAPAFGEDDYQVSRKYNLPVVQPVDKSGKFTEEVTDFKHRFVKDADEDIIQKLRSEKKLYKKEKYAHSYPHCWRCHSPLLYYARESWYINTSSYKEKMIELNNQINWYPPETGTGRFGNWLEENRDWALSRDRYWGTPLPVWTCNNKECDSNYEAIGSISELKERSVNFDKVFPDEESLDLHKPKIDDIIIKCSKCGSEMNRVEEVIDAWYDSGSMPFAQFHYPFENKELFEQNYPADFIAEAVDQTRGWFYSLHAIGTFLFNEKAFKNLIVNDLILDKTGQKMSKHKGNLVDPFAVMQKYGADILRWYLIYSSPPWRPKMFNEDDLQDVRNKFFDTLINTYRFFVLYSNLSSLDYQKLLNNPVEVKDRAEIDRWIISALNTLKRDYLAMMDTYDLTRASRLISDFTIDDLSNWYVRRNRKRFRNPENDKDKYSAYITLYEVLTELFKMVSPIAPFLTEELYRNITGNESVHLSSFGKINENDIDAALEQEMRLAQKIVYLVRTMRVKFNLKTRQPLKQILIPETDELERLKIERMKKIILEEVNVKELNFIGEESGIIVKKAKPNFKLLGPKYGKELKVVTELIKSLDTHTINLIANNGSLETESGGTKFVINFEDFEVYTENVEGWVVESDGNLMVALDTKLDDELISEGLAREFINRIQNMRKDKNMGVNDRIKIQYDCDEELSKALMEQNNYIKEETFAVEFFKNNSVGQNGFEELNINGRICKVNIIKL